MLGLLFDGTRRIDRVLHGAYAGDRTDLAIAGHQAGVHLGDAIAGQGGTTAGVEFGSVFHDVDGGDHSLMRRCSGFQQLVSGIEGALQIKFDLGDAFRRAVLATTARSGVNDKRDAGFSLPASSVVTGETEDVVISCPFLESDGCADANVSLLPHV